MKNYYQILEIEPTATQEQIKSQYRLLVHAWHPDKFPNAELKDKAQEHLIEVNEAYSILGDPLKRHNYDKIFGFQTPASPTQATESESKVTESELSLIWERWDRYDKPKGIKEKVWKLADPLNWKIMDLILMLNKLNKDTASSYYKLYGETTQGPFLLCYYIGYDLASGKMARSDGTDYLVAATASIDNFALKILGTLLKHGMISQEQFAGIGKEIAFLTGEVSNNICILGIENFRIVESQVLKNEVAHTRGKGRYYCQICGILAETKYVALYENVGMLFRRRTRSIKGNLCKYCIDYYFWDFTHNTMGGSLGIISIALLPFILANNLLRFILSMGLTKPSERLTPRPSGWRKFSTISGYLVMGSIVIYIALFMEVPSYSREIPQTLRTPILATKIPSAIPTVLKATSFPTKTPLPPTIRSFRLPTSLPEITYHGIPCSPWNFINSSDIGRRMCIYGKVYTYGPYSNEWTYIKFSPDQTTLRVIDYNYEYYTPLQLGDCAIIYGLIRDNGSHLVIAPEFDADDRIQTTLPEFCNLPP